MSEKPLFKINEVVVQCEFVRIRTSSGETIDVCPHEDKLFVAVHSRKGPLALKPKPKQYPSDTITLAYEREKPPVVKSETEVREMLAKVKEAIGVPEETLTSGLLAGSALALKWVLGESDLKSLDPRETTPND